MDNKDFLYKFFGFKNALKLVKYNGKATNKDPLKKDKITSENFRAAGNNLYAQKNHDKDVHTNTLIEYNKSIAFAPQDSEQLALGFSNRSALLLHLHRYKECLIDIDRALEITKSDQLKSKLQSRKEKCLLMHRNATEGSVEKSIETLKIKNEKMTDLELPIVKSKKIPYAAECVSIKSHETYKRQLTATRDIKPGEIVIVEKAYACSLSNCQRYLICSHCFDFAWNGIPCDFCVNSIYCSETCKKEAWTEYHDYECSILPFIISFYSDISIKNPNTMDTMFTILLAKIFIKAVKAEGFQSVMNETELIDNGTFDPFSNGEFQSNRFGYVYSLRSRPQKEFRNFKECTHETLVMYLLVKHTNLIPVANKLKEVTASDEKLLIRMRDIFIKLKSIIELNVIRCEGCKCNHTNVGACNDECILFKGAVIVPCSTVSNHSCVPNINKFFLPQPKITVYATKPIKKGEQLCFTYGPVFTIDLAERKRCLKENMNHLCQCLACMNNQSFQKLNKETVKFKYAMVRMEFQKIYGDNSHMHTMDFFKNPLDFSKWNIFTRASLDQALKLIELYFKYFEYDQACIMTFPLDTYINKVVCVLYGDRSIVMDHC